VRYEEWRESEPRRRSLAKTNPSSGEKSLPWHKCGRASKVKTGRVHHLVASLLGTTERNVCVPHDGQTCTQSGLSINRDDMVIRNWSWN
jgi:hypothetical protein